MANVDPKVNSLLEERQRLVKQLTKFEEIQKNIEAIDRVLKIYGYNGSKAPIIPAEIEEKVIKNYSILGGYSPALTWNEKCLYALRLIGAGYVPDVARKIHDLEPAISVEMAESRAKFSLSKLYRDNEITVASKNGRKYKYSIKI